MVSKSMFNPLFSPITALTTELLKQSGLSGCHYVCGGSVPAKNMSEPGLDVADCVKRARQKDEEAARQLVEHLYPLVFKLVRAYLPGRTSEEDLAQIVFMKVFANLDRYSSAVPLEHWVARIAINTCLNQIQAEKIRPELRRADLSEAQCQVLDTLGAVSQELPPDQALAAREVVEKLLALLDPVERLLLTLLHLEGHSPREVQRMTGWNGALVRVRAFRARQKLKKHYQKLSSERNTHESP
jgi:RNA polymerase sigma-70 factor (ECF subfamily)